MDDIAEAITSSPAKSSTASTPSSSSTTHNQHTDDESITTSTESDANFDTWTLVTEKNSSSSDNKSKTKCSRNQSDQHAEDRVEVLTDDERQQEDARHRDADASNNDELSDGISIISECESAGRMSPHPYLQDHLDTLNLKYIAEEQEKELLQRSMMQASMRSTGSESMPRLRRNRTSTENNDVLDASANESRTALQPLSADSRLIESDSSLLQSPLVRRGLTGFFYLAVGVALLAFIGKLRYPEWEPLASSKPIETLEQRVNDMELQNNLMRAEIDLLSRQVKYLSELNGGKGEFNKFNMDDKKRKSFKVWMGNGDNIQPLDITKHDLKKPYKCPNGQFVEVAGMCVESAKLNVDPLVEHVSDVVHDVLQQTEQFKTLEKMGAKLEEFQENPFEAASNMLNAADGGKLETGYNDARAQYLDKQQKQQFNQQQARQENFKKQKGEKRRDNYQEKPANEGVHEKYHNAHKKYDDDKHEKNFNNKNAKPDYNKQRGQQQTSGNSKQDDSGSHERNNSQERNKSRERNNSQERKNKSRERNNSKERQHNNNKQQANNSKEQRRFGKTNSAEQKQQRSGEWHEKYMQHREQARHKHEHEQQRKNGKNWYIERGDSREYIRHADAPYK